MGEDGFRRWMLKVYSIEEGSWFEKLVLTDVVGSELEIIDGYFYGISSQTMFIVEQIDWTSFYHCFRFPWTGPSQMMSKVYQRGIPGGASTQTES